MDGTLIQGTVFEAILKASGKAAEVEASDRAYFAGEIGLKQCFWQQWEWIKELTPGDIHRALRTAPWLPGIGEGVRRLKAAGHQVHLLTDQPAVCAEYLARWGLSNPICSPTTVKDGIITGVEARFDKRANLEARLSSEQASMDDVVHVGNGSNDIPVWKAARGIAVFAPVSVAAQADVDLGEPREFGDIVDAILEL